MHHVPHRFPFEWIDVCQPGRCRVRLTATGPFNRQVNFPDFFAVEILAQACLAGLDRADQGESGENQARTGLLAGIDQVNLLPALHQRPLRAGDTLEIEVARTASFGRLIKVRGVMSRDGEAVLEGELLLALG